MILTSKNYVKFKQVINNKLLVYRMLKVFVQALIIFYCYNIYLYTIIYNFNLPYSYKNKLHLANMLCNKRNNAGNSGLV